MSSFFVVKNCCCNTDPGRVARYKFTSVQRISVDHEHDLIIGARLLENYLSSVHWNEARIRADKKLSSC